MSALKPVLYDSVLADNPSHFYFILAYTSFVFIRCVYFFPVTSMPEILTVIPVSSGFLAGLWWLFILQLVPFRYKGLKLCQKNIKFCL
jgi:hypothetical protein